MPGIRFFGDEAELLQQEGGALPHNETSIAVNPTNRMNLIGAANDYQLRLSSGGRGFETILTRAHVTFDGGQTWTTYELPLNGYLATGDPAIAFDADGTAYASTLGFLFSQGLACCVNPDIVTSHSSDGGKTWVDQTTVAHGSGVFGSRGVFNDKEYITAGGTATRSSPGLCSMMVSRAATSVHRSSAA